MALLPGTFVLMMHDMINLFVIIVIACIMLAMLGCLVYGYRVQQMADFGEALYTTLKYVILGDDRCGGEFGRGHLLAAPAQSHCMPVQG